MAFINNGFTEKRQLAVTYSLTDSLTNLAARINLALREAAAMTANGNTPTGGFAVVVSHPIPHSPTTAISMTTNATSYGVYTDAYGTSSGYFLLNCGPTSAGLTNTWSALTDSNSGSGSLLTKLSLSASNMPSGNNNIGSVIRSNNTFVPQVINTSAFSESITYTVGSETDINGLAAALQTAIRAAGKLGTSQSYDVSAATVTIDGSNHLAIDVSTGSSGVIVGTITGATLPTTLGLPAAPAAAAVTSTATFSSGGGGSTQTETATVTYSTTDTLASIATKIQAAVTSIGSVGSSSVANGAGSAANFASGVISITGVDGNTSLAFSSGALQTALNLGTPDTSVSGTVSSSGTIVQDKYRLDSITLTGSGSSSTVDISTQASASAAISSLDTSIDSVSTTRASLGALQTQLDSAARTISVAAENASVAESRISDADLAEFMSEMVQAQIREQAGISMMVQANHAPSIVLQLLK